MPPLHADGGEDLRKDRDVQFLPETTRLVEGVERQGLVWNATVAAREAPPLPGEGGLGARAGGAAGQ